MNYVRRNEYMNQLLSWKDKQLIKVVSGVRRCGKSTLFKLYIEYLKSIGIKNEQIIEVNLEDIEYEALHSYKELYQYIKSKLYLQGSSYVFIDEVQQCDGFERAVDSLFIQENVDIYITGSNAYMLSGELATLLSGRYIEISMLPLSFKEYVEYLEVHHLALPATFTDYVRYGSFPYAAVLEKNDITIKLYLDGIYNTILVKDISKHEGIVNVEALERIVKFLCSNIGSPISTKKICDNINASGRKISVNTVDRYLHALTDSFIFYRAERYDIKGRNLLKTLGKYYVVDTGFRNLLIASSSPDIGHQLENIVYLELLRRGNKVYIGKVGNNEVDFVAEGNSGRVYYQVSASVLNEETLKRELKPLQEIRDNHPKYLLTLDDIMPKANHDGILQRNVLEWLTK